MMRSFKFLALLVLFPLMAIPTAHAQGGATTHPLDGLDAGEIALAVDLLRAEGHVDGQTLFHYVGLAAPPKSAVTSGQPDAATDRRVVAVVRNGAKTFEAIVELNTRRIQTWREIEGVQPNILNTEWALANRLVRSDPRWRSAMERRGFEDFTEIYCATLTVGNFGGEENRRLVRMPCYDISAGGPNIYARPIDGVEATVDLNRAVVESVHDAQIRTDSSLDYNPDRLLGLPENHVTQAPTNYARPDLLEINGSTIAWRDWSFHLRTDFRVGPILSLIQFGPENEKRSILYQANLSELIVPYMSEDRSWYYRTYMDVGEYGFGAASRLFPGLDCPAGARMISSTFADDTGQPYEVPNNACLFVRFSAQPTWRHSEIYNNSRSIELGQELVLRTIPTVGNYDYIIDWVFSPTGEIRIEVGATGIVAVRGINSSAQPDDGTLVARDLVAVNHDHFFSFRLDFDIDGASNRVQIDRIAPAPDCALSPRRIWSAQPEPVTVEAALQGGVDVIGWRVTNHNMLNALGQHPGYQVINGSPATAIYAEGDLSLARSQFATAPIWVTQHQPDEHYAAGRFPNQSQPGLGLIEYIDGENIVDADVVLWPTLGMRHVPRPEEWPIMSTMTRSITIRPFGFHPFNPAFYPDEMAR